MDYVAILMEFLCFYQQGQNTKDMCNGFNNNGICNRNHYTLFCIWQKTPGDNS